MMSWTVHPSNNKSDAVKGKQVHTDSLISDILFAHTFPA